MPRKGLRPRDRRPPPPADYRYKSVLVSRLINKLDHAGRKAQAERVMYDALEIVAEKTKEPALDVFTRAIENIRPLLEVKARRVGGATYQVPIEVSVTRSTRSPCAGCSTRPTPRAASRWPSASPKRSSRRTRRKESPSRSVKTPTRWPKPTELSPITAGRPATP